MSKSKKANGRSRAHKPAHETAGARRQAPVFVARMQEGLRDAGDAFREAGEAFGDEGRKVALKLVNHAQDNVVWSFEALRDTIQAESFAEAVRIQQNAMTELFRRSLRQMREVGEIVGESSTRTLKPITRFVASVRDAA